MAMPNYPEVNNLDELFGFSAAREKAAQNLEGSNPINNSGFIPHRVFMNQVDSFNSKHISSFLTDQICGGGKSPEGGEGEGEGEELGEEETELVSKIKPPQFKYEIIGTLLKSFHNKTEDILFTIDEDSEEFYDNVMKCGIVIYDITHDSNEIDKALKTLTVMDSEIEKLKDLGPKTFKNIKEVRVFVLISTVMTWANTKPIDPDDPELPFTEADYKKRRAHPNFAAHMECEKQVVMMGRKNKDKLKTYVIASGIIYGADEEDFFFLFKLAWNNELELPIFNSGKQRTPLIHIKDLSKVIHALIEKAPKKPQYILAVEQTPAKFKQIVKALAKTMGSGKTKDVAAEEAFFYSEIFQSLYDKYTVNLTMEPGFITEDLEIEWQNELNLAENMPSMVNEFKKTRELKPVRVIIHGPPAIGKTLIAKQLSEFYGAHYINVKMIVDDHIQGLQKKIEEETAKALAKEEKEKAGEEPGEPEEEDEEVEEEEVNIEELSEQLREIQATIAESENGKLPDDQVNELVKEFILSNQCQNQGYILDGYPKTMEQTKAIFGGGEEGGEEAVAEEEGDEGAHAGESKLLPEFVISLQATDEFLCERIMNLLERDIQGTHYTEENMMRRLATFRANNTEDNTLLNFFDEIEIHPIVLDAMADISENMSNIMEKVMQKMGKAVRFSLTPEEEEELMLLENEKKKLLEKNEQMQNELLQRRAAEDYQNKMEQWTDTLEQLQTEEEKILAAQAEPLRHYLIKFVFPTLSKGLLEVAKMKPSDPVDFLAEYLFKENPEGHMFDPAYTRDGKRIMDNYTEQIEKEIKQLSTDNKDM